MYYVEKLLKNTIEKCDICIDGDVISKELLLQTLVRFLDDTINKAQHNVGFILHTGSKCFDVIVLVYAALYNLMNTEYNPEELVRSLTPGDYVLYYKGKKPSKFTFGGFADSSNQQIPDDSEYIILKQGEHSSMYIPQKLWSRVVPYYGKSEKLGGVGLRKEDGKRAQFCKDILGLTDKEIPRTIDVSTVVVLSRERANELINGISISFSNISMSLTELVPVSYYTESEQMYQYGTNIAKIEPVLKLTGKVSVARKLLLRKSANRNHGLIVLGEDLIKRGETELPELLDRKSLLYGYVCTHIDSESIPTLVHNYEDAYLFACTKDYLLSNTLPTVVPNSATAELECQIDAIIDREITQTVSGSILTLDRYKEFKRALFQIKAADYDTDEKDNFIVQAYSLMNLYLTAPFTTAALDTAIAEQTVSSIASVEERIAFLRTSSVGFPQYLAEASRIIVAVLEEGYLELYEKCPKATSLEEILINNKGQKIVVVTPKAYYAPVIQKYCPFASDVEIVTANRFDNTRVYDLIVVLGNLDGTRFNIFRCKSAPRIQVLLYEHELYHYKKTEKRINDEERLYNKRSTLFEDYTDSEEETAIINDASEELTNIDKEIEQYIESSVVRMTKSMGGYGESKNVQADVAAIARLDSGEYAFFSKNYKAYVLDPVTKTATETKCAELGDGDTIVFTRSSSKTRDVVESLLEQLIKDNKLSKSTIDAYVLSRRWKKVLVDYLNRPGQTAKKIAEVMILNGVTVQEITIRGWLDEDSHTVGPRKVDSIQQIALLAGDDELFDQAEKCFEACATIRKIRRVILDAIAQAILGSLSGDSKDDVITATVKEQVSGLATIMKIEKITFVNEQMPVNMVNKPILIKGKLGGSYNDY